jgi:hypothetical protein
MTYTRGLHANKHVLGRQRRYGDLLEFKALAGSDETDRFHLDCSMRDARP